MEELTKYKLGEIAKIYNGSTPSTLDASNYDGDIIWATPKDLSDQNSKYFSKGARNITQKGFDSCSTQMIPANNILMSSRAPIGLFAINTVDCCTNQGFKNIVLDKAIADVDFMYYFLKYHVKEIEALGSGTTFREVSKTAFEKYEISIPSLPTQQKIASVLSKLDRKISVNREINRNLEELAKQIYDYWFVQFDFPNKEGKPYKSSGGKMVWNDVLKREIPDGWEVKSVNDIATSYRGVGYSAKDEKSFKDKNIVLILRGNNISNGHIVYDDNTVYVDKSFVSSEQEIKKYDVIITMSSGSKDHVGKSAMFLFDSPHSYGAFCNKLTPKKNYQFFLANYLHSEYFIKCIRQFASGTGINNLTNEHFSKTIFSFPPNKIISDFNMKVEKIYQQLGIFEQENMKLISLRDSLLPFLMSGQVTLNSCLSHD